MRQDLIIAIDGPSGVGKSSAAKALGGRLGYLYLESGALYRAIAWKAVQERVDPEDLQGLEDLCRRIDISIQNVKGQARILVGQKDVTDELKTPALDRLSSILSALAPVRERLLHLQRELGRRGGIIMEGRDIGSVVFPDAHLKFYLDAKMATRAKRRHAELRQRGLEVHLEEVQKEIELRDRRDTERDLAPLRRAEDAIYLDTTDLTLEQVVDKMMGEFSQKV